MATAPSNQAKLMLRLGLLVRFPKPRPSPLTAAQYLQASHQPIGQLNGLAGACHFLLAAQFLSRRPLKLSC